MATIREVHNQLWVCKPTSRIKYLSDMQTGIVTHKRYLYNKDWDEYQLVLNDYELQNILDYFGLLDEKDTITGALVLIGEGEYLDVWLTESNAPYDLISIYRQITWYLTRK